MIADNYVSILFPYHLFIEYGIFGSFRRHSIIDLLKYNSALIYK